jgi:chorismate--pyruvate lyase
LRYAHEPVWFTRAHRDHHAVPLPWRDWLEDSGSLTRRLQGLCDEFNVQLLDSGRARPQVNEAHAMGLHANHYALVRHVYLRCADTPIVFARTVIPDSTLTGAERRLAHLGNKPLGAVLFADPHMQRSEVEIARLTPGHSLFEVATRGLSRKPAHIWGRRSLFWLSGKPLLVNEIFLPALMKL